MNQTEDVSAVLAERPELLIEPSAGWAALQLGELWEYRELLYFLVWREIKIRYQQTILGVGWAIIQPLFSMLVFTLFFGRLAKMPSDGIPYSVFSLTALVPWTFFVSGLSQASTSLVANANLIGKVYFPRLAIPIASVLSGLLDFVFSFILLLGYMAYYGIVPGVAILWLPAFLLLAVVTALGAGLWLSALNVEYRDIKYVIPFLTQLWMFATPIVYPSSLLPEPWRTVYGINPMAGVVEGFRWALLGSGAAPGMMFVVSFVAATLILVTGIFYFRRMEQTFADVV